MTLDVEFQNAVFRYRAMDSLLGDRKELEKQTIYFAPPEQLNDPMEGLRQLYWRGDRITWQNFLRHYVICLHDRFFQCLVAGDDLTLTNTIGVFRYLKNFPTPQAQNLCEECITAIEGQELHAALLDLLESVDRNISFDELLQLLRTVHSDWLIAVHGAFHRHQLVTQAPRLRPQSKNLAASLRVVRENIPHALDQLGNSGWEIMNEIQQKLADEMNLLVAYQNLDVISPNRTSLILEFPRQYLNSLMKLVYPPWYVACFSTHNDNAAMWSYYANNHNGCCLVFNTKATEGGRTLRLKGVNGYGTDGVLKGQQNLMLEPVRYTTDDQRIEFFTNIGRLSHRDLMQNWFQDESGKTSSLAQHLSNETNRQWRDAYWENFSPPLFRKLPDWQHEQEYRIILSDALNLYESDEGRTFTYDCDTLDGIIFGINVSVSDEARVMQIVDQKLHEESVARGFTFYQARYNQRLGKIEVLPLRLIRHRKNRAK